jgi:uncharacterized protein
MRRDIQFYSETSLLQGHLYLPEGSSPDSKLPCVILCHGFAGVKELLLPKFAQAFAEKGFAALTFDYRGFGASGGEKGRLVWREQVRDIRNAITFAGTLDEVNPERIALWGTSYGGANIIETASQDHRVKCLVVQISFGDGERVITGGQTPEQKEKLLAMLEKARQREVAKGRPMMLPIEQILTDAQSKQFFKDNVQEFPCLDSKLSILFIKHTLEYHPEDRLPHLRIFPSSSWAPKRTRRTPSPKPNPFMPKPMSPSASISSRAQGIMRFIREVSLRKPSAWSWSGYKNTWFNSTFKQTRNLKDSGFVRPFVAEDFAKL